MPLRPKQRILRIDLSDRIYDQVWDYAAAVYPGESVQSAVYELLQMGMGHDARNAAIRTARHQAYRDMQKFILKAVWDKFKTIKSDLDSVALAIELSSNSDGSTGG